MTDTTLFDLSDWTQIAITGKDRQSFLHSFCTNDIKQLQPGEGCEAFIPSIKGRILGHVLVFAEVERLLLVAVPQSNAVLVPHLTKYLLGVDAQVTDLTENTAVFCICGEDTSQVIQKHLGVDLPEKLYAHAERSGEGGEFLIARAGFSTLPTAIVLTSTAALKAVKAEFLAAGCKDGTLEEFHQLRIAAGFPWHGVDISEDNIAQEAARTSQAISFNKGCYLGQEPIARLDAMGHTNKELRGLLITSVIVPQPGDTVYSQDKTAGTLTSVARLNDHQSIALGIIKKKYAQPGSDVSIESDGQHLSAKIFWESASSA